jgi:hypothetical protein
MRYGHQQYSEIMAMPIDEMCALADEIGRIVEAENEASKPKE